MEISAAHRQILLNAARASIEGALRGRPPGMVMPVPDDPVLSMAAGCFVTLHDRSSRRLRGCIGRLESRDPLLKSINETACSVLQDPRFRSHPVTVEEMVRLDLEISVLSPLREAANVLDFDPPTEGIYLMCDGRVGTFLPQVARETGWSREQLLTRLCTEKMGLSATAWQEGGVKLLKYSVVVIGPEPLVKETVGSEVGVFGKGNVFRV
ncbi:MAG: AmmeMemoRadiSam system protein A [Planctomycetota bacterium]|nr:AmmeMemoRadiSam system protein A [Planctomycetota bacterium]